MILQLYCVYDNKLEEYLPPFHSANDATAVRAFEGAISQETHDFHTHSEDYSLWLIGNFETEKAQILCEPIHCIAQAHELLAKLQGFEDQAVVRRIARKEMRQS